MGHQYAGVSTSFATDYTIPDDGDAENAASVNVAFQALGDRTAFLNVATAPLANLAALIAITTPTNNMVRHVKGFGFFVFDTGATAGLSPFAIAAGDATPGAWVSSTAHQTSLVKLCGPGCMAPQLVMNGATAPSLTAVAFSAINTTDITLFRNSLQFNTVVGTSNALGVSLGLDPYLIDGATLSQIRIRVAPQAHAGLPTLLPKFGVLRTAFDQTTATLLSTGAGLGVDASANAAAYQAAHWNVFTPDQNNVIDRTQYSYSLQLWNEGGTNALNSLVHTSIEITMSPIPDARRF